MSFPGYAGKVLFIDLTREETREEPLDPELVEKFLGGWGINNWLAHEVISPPVDAFAPENALILGAGPFTGTTIPGSTKLLVTTKFPINKAFATASGGGAFTIYLKSCGYDHVVISGKASRPVCIVFSTDKAMLIDAVDLLGKDNYETVDILWQRYWPCSVIPIGPAGENLVVNSITSVDKTSSLGRGGLPAVMGAKNLKAMVAIQGKHGVKVAEHLGFQKLADSLHQRVMSWRGRPQLIEHGLLGEGISIHTPYPPTPLSEAVKESMKEIHVSMRRTLACPSCSLGEKSRVCLADGRFAGVLAYMPHLWMENLGGDDREAYDRAIKYSDVLNRLGLCHMNFTHTLLFLCRLFKEGSISKEDTGGLELKWNLETALTVARLTAERKGFGEVMAGGPPAVIAHLKEELGRRLEQVKGHSSVFDPRLTGLGTMEFSQIINPRGSHMAAGGSPSYEPGRPLEDFVRHAERMGAEPEAIARAVGEGKFNAGRYTRFSDEWYSLFNCLGLCNRAFVNRFYHVNTITDLYRALTGREVSVRDLMAAAARAYDLAKVLNAQVGFSRKDDKPPTTWFDPVTCQGKELRLEDYSHSKKLTPADMESFLNDYYDEHGYETQTGLPGPKRLAELGIEWGNTENL